MKMKLGSLTTVIVVSLFLINLFIPDLIAQQGRVNYSEPRPVGSANEQVGQGTPKKSDATHVKFFSHPSAFDDSHNFKQDKRIKIDGTYYEVGDVVAVPGLVPDEGNRRLTVQPRDTMLEATGTSSGNKAMHGFSPNRFVDGQYYLGMEFSLGDTNSISHQLEVADIRSPRNPGEFKSIFGEDPLEKAFLGDGREDQKPYDISTYPGTVINKVSPFDWTFLYPSEKGKYSIKDVITYDIANLDAGLITLSHDPLNLDLSPQLLLGVGAAQIKYLLSTSMNLPYLSPTVFFKKMVQDTVKLSGYSTLQLPRGGGQGIDLFNNLASMLAHNLNPIAVEKFNVQVTDYITSYAILNRVVLPNEQLMLNYVGNPRICKDGKAHPWGDLWGIEENGIFTPVSNIIPHPNFSFGTIWTSDRGVTGIIDGWNNNQNVGNPNEIFAPLMFFIAPPGSWDMAVVKKAGVDKSLVIASGDSTCPNYNKNCSDGKYYLYMVSPSDHSRNMYERSCLDLTNTSENRYISVPRTFEITPPVDKFPNLDSSEGYAPYQIACGNLNIDVDDISDCVVSWRGKNTKVVGLKVGGRKKRLTDPTADVYFVSDLLDANGNNLNQRMFANGVTVYYGTNDANGNIIFVTEANSAQYPNLVPRYIPAYLATSQIAAVEISDIDKDGKSDILMGDVVAQPVKGDINKSAGQVHAAFGPLFVEKKMIPVGFTRGKSVDPIKFVSGLEDGIMGVASIDVDDPLPNIAAVTNKQPLSLRPICCNNAKDPECADSPTDTLLSHLYYYLPKVMEQLATPSARLIDKVQKVASYPFADKNAPYYYSASCQKIEVCKIQGDEIALPPDHECCLDPCNIDKCGNIGVKKTKVKKAQPAKRRQPVSIPEPDPLTPIPWNHSANNPACTSAVFAPSVEKTLMLAMNDVTISEINTNLLLAQADADDIGYATDATQPMMLTHIRDQIVEKMQRIEAPEGTTDEFIVKSDELISYINKAMFQPENPTDIIASMLFYGMVKFLGYDLTAIPIPQSVDQASNQMGELPSGDNLGGQNLAQQPQLSDDQNISNRARDLAKPIENRIDLSALNQPPPPSNQIHAEMREEFRQPIQGSIRVEHNIVANVRPAVAVVPSRFVVPQPPGGFKTFKGLSPRGMIMQGQGEVTVVINKDVLECQRFGPLTKGDECNADNRVCKPDQICSTDCICESPGAIVKEVPKYVSATEPTCTAEVSGYSDAEIAELYKEMVDEVVLKTGLTHYRHIGEPSYSTITVRCFFPLAAQTKQSVSPSLAPAGSRLPGVGKGNKFAIFQTAGDISNRDFTKDFEPLPTMKSMGIDNLLLAPLPTAQGSITLPLMSASNVPSVLQKYQNYPVTDLSESNGTTIINKVVTVSSGVDAMADSQQTGLGTNAIVTNIRATPKSLAGRFSGLGDMKKADEDTLTFEEYLTEIDNRVAKGTKGTALLVGLGDNDYMIVQDKVTGDPYVTPFAVASKPLSFVAAGHGCGCSALGNEKSAALVHYLIIAISLLGIGIGYMRRRRRSASY
ncbi:MAG: hypothetical protein ABIE74_09125 [Pseudomonadota bacterium]